jgi:CBS domain containing-hemolysin-like protein
LAIGGALMSCLGAIGARALREFSRHHLQELCERNQRLDRFGDVVRLHDEVALGVEMFVGLASTLFVAAGTLYAWERFAPLEPAWPELLVVVLTLACAMAVTNVCLPWAIARVGAERFLYYTWPCWRWLSWPMIPLIWSARSLVIILRRVTGRKLQQDDEDSFEEEIRTIVTEGHREGLLEEEAREMIEGVMELRDVVVSHIMTPRTDMSMLQVHQPWEEVLDYVTSVGHTRIPVYDKNRDDIVGILYSKDLLPELAKGADEPQRPLGELLRKPLFVPESKAVNELLQLFQQIRTHIAIVLDEYGGTAGLVTIEDLLEEIVGEIQDEYDEEEPMIVRLSDDEARVDGRASVDDLVGLFEISPALEDDDEFDTVGGLIYHRVGGVPSPGDQVQVDGLRLTVESTDGRRVSKVLVVRERRADEDPAPDDEADR